MKTTLRYLFLLLAAQLVLSACSSTKSREDQGPVARLWHNMNSQYNGFFNASEIMEESLLVLEEQHEDNYAQRLEMFPFLAVDNPGVVSAELDRAIEKVAIVVKKHPYSNWADDAYLLVGQAQLLKQDYESAERTLEFMTTEFRPRPERKKAKKGETPAGEDEFESRREIAGADNATSRRDRLRARKLAQRERERIKKQRDKERKQKARERDKERKARIRARKKGKKLPPRTTTTPDSLLLANEPEAAEEVVDEGPVGMISIFSNRDEAGSDGQFGSKPETYFLKNRPAYQEGRLWLAWTLIKRDNYDRAQLILEDLRNDRGTFADIRQRALAVQAFLYLEQEKLEEAIPFLEEAAEVAETRNERARFYYIAGQLEQELNRPGQAVKNFEQVIAARPAYPLELGARISMAQNDPGTSLAKLERMVKEDKNLEYQSQILFAMAGIALRNDDREAGAEYLRRALDNPYGSGNTRSEAYLLLADLAYDEGEYLPAKLYYDSTLQVMTQSDLRYGSTDARRAALEGIATNLADIELKDSLLRIGNLSPVDQRNWAEEVFELRRATNSAANFSTPAQRGSIPVSPSGAPLAANDSDFWGYNPQVLKRGQREFEKKWGDRPLTDNWRRKLRTDAELFNDPEDELVTVPGEEVSLVTEDEINKILADIPTDDNAKRSMENALAEAYFNLGRDLRDRVEDGAAAIVAFEEMNRRFPGFNKQAESWYYLYLLHKEEGNAAEAARYADLLGTKYRGSRYAKLANDPNYINEVATEERRREREYEEAFALFEAGQYQRVLDLSTAGQQKLLAQHPLRPRYALLSAMSTGQLQGREAYVNGLRQLISRFSDSPEAVRAREILRLLGEGSASLPGRNSQAAAATGFRESAREIHYVLVAFNDKDVDLNQLKVGISDFNTKYHKQQRLRVTPIYIGGKEDQTPVLVMRRYKDGEEAKEYYENARSNDREFLDPAKHDYTLLPVSQTNYRQILKAKTIDGYEEWFLENYGIN